MDLRLETYEIHDVDLILTPALVVYPALVDANIRATLQILGGDANRWRPHIKTAKLGAVLRQMIEHSVVNFKCSTTLELLSACEAGAADVLLAYTVMGANARRTREIASEFPETRVSVLVEAAEQAETWLDGDVGVFVDINSGMNRTGVDQDRIEYILELASTLGDQFRGLHYYDGHVAAFPSQERERHVHEGYDRLLEIANALERRGIPPGEIITSGTPATPFAVTYPRFRDGSVLHRVSPGTVVFNDITSIEQLPAGLGYQPAVLVLSTVVSHPTPQSITCDAGHKSVSADAGVPTCLVIGRSDLKPMKPSEEHLSIEGLSGGRIPSIGDKLYLLPRHVCPTVNNFDEAVCVVDGHIRAVETVTARGHESPLALFDRATTV